MMDMHGRLDGFQSFFIISFFSAMPLAISELYYILIPMYYQQDCMDRRFPGFFGVSSEGVTGDLDGS